MKVCKSCGTESEPTKKTKGSFIIELFLWIIFFPVGLCYSLWRLTGKKDICQVCESSDLIDSSTPVGMKILKDMSNL